MTHVPTFEELKQRFEKEVDTSCIKYDWDCGYCYSYLDTPVIDSLEKDFDKCLNETTCGSPKWKLVMELYNQWQHYLDNWLYENDGPYYNTVEIEGDTLNDHGDILTGVEAKDYAEGLIKLLQQYDPDNTLIEKLEYWLISLVFEKEVFT